MRFTEQLRQFFSSKRRQSLEASREAGTEHSGLLGSHRETIMRDYLAALLPGRFQVGRGMVYGFAHRSREADLVIWDHINYPSLRMRDHSLFFAESARLVLEAKSRWSSGEFEDILTKCQAVRDIVPMHAPNLADDIAMMHLEITSIRSGNAHSGIMRTPHHIATAGLVLFGGTSLVPSKLEPKWVSTADDCWPDVLLLLDEGKVVWVQIPECTEFEATNLAEILKQREGPSACRAINCPTSAERGSVPPKISAISRADYVKTRICTHHR